MEGQEAARRIDGFLDLYKQLEDALEDKYRNARRHYPSVVYEFEKDYESAPVRDKLEVCREIRNLLTHTANLDGEPVVEPSQPVVDALQEVLDFVKQPPLALEFATKGDQVMKAHMHQKVLRLMEVMDKNGYSHIPVLENGEFCGVFSVGCVFQYLLRSGGKGIKPDTTVAELGKYIALPAHTENYQFVPKDATYAKLQQHLTAAGYGNYFIGTVEATPSLDDVLALVQDSGAKKVVLLPLMIVAGDHANNDMAGDEEGSWKTTFEQAGFEVECVLRGLGQYEEIQNMFVEHVGALIAQ